ncbi:MAG TPA: hypothetical protein VF746_02890 [Longimicrobium sp.]
MTTSRMCTVLLCAAATLLAPACAGSPPPAPPPPPALTGGDSILVFAALGARYHHPVETVELATLHLAHCGARAREEARDTIVGPGGGTVTLPSGHSLHVPRNTLKEGERYVFGLAQAADSAHLVLEVSGGGAPEPFAPPVTITFNTTGCSAPAPGRSRRVVRLRMGSPGTDVGGTHDPGGVTFRASLTELSRYALAQG